MLSPLAASADEGSIAPGSTGAESKIQNGVLTGVERTPNAYFVEFAGAPVSAGGSLTAIQSERDAFLADAADAGVEISVRNEFGSLWNGISVSAAEEDLLTLAESQVVTAIYPVGIIDAPELPEGEIDPDLFSAIGMTGADVVQSELGFTGEGIKVGVIDTGIDYDHPDLGGGGTPGGDTFPTARVTHGYDFVGDDYNADPGGPGYSPRPIPDANPDDCQGHGTHVAGIVGAQGEVTGVAPDVTFGAYRVFGCDGSTESDIMLHAMEMSLEDGMDVVNLSVGAAFASWAEYPTSQATDALTAEGVVVVASIGNEGDLGLHAAGSPGVGVDTIGVGSVDNVGYLANALLDGEGNPMPYATTDSQVGPPTSGTSSVVAVAEPDTPEALGCEPYSAEDAAVIDGNWLLVQRGTCSFHQKSLTGQEAGAAGVIIYNNVPGLLNATVAGDPPITIPVVAVGDSDGEALVADYLADGELTVTWTDETTSAPNPTGGLMSGFSSYGPTADMRIKPDLSAPGGSIYSTYPLEKQPYGSLSGTSMASPHVAGAVALMLEADPATTPLEARTELQNSAIQLPWSGNPAAGTELVQKQGAGMIQVDKAILAETYLAPGFIQLGQQLAGESSTHTVTLTNTSDAAQTYAVSTEHAIATYGTANDYYYNYADAGVAVSAESVEVPAGGTATVDVTITSPAADEDGTGAVFGGYVHFTSGEDVYTVGYGGSAHDLQDVEVLADMIDLETGEVTTELPVLAKLAECDFFEGIDCTDPEGSWNIFPEGGATYTMADGDVPSVAIHFEHQARQMVWTAFEANADGTKGASLGVVKTEDYLSRSAGRNAIGVHTWDGRTVADNGAREVVPSGDYILEVEVTKASAFNDDREPGVETWTSPAFEIAWAGDSLVMSPVVDRALGHNRYATASELALAHWESGADTVYIASGQNYPDALSGGALAGIDGSPLLLVREDGVPGPTAMALQILKPTNIVILGGSAAVADEVADELDAYGDVSRIAGKDRYATAAEISQEIAAPGEDLVFLASGRNFPDALAASAVAGQLDAPVLLTADDELSSAAADELARLSPDRIVVLGGTVALSDAVEEAASAYSDDVSRIAGTNRYGTAAQLADAFFEAPVDHAMVATGQDFPDALSTGPVAALNEAPVLLTRSDSLPQSTLETVIGLKIQKITITGGLGAVSLAVEEALAAVTYPAP